MSKSAIWNVIGILSLFASAAMYVIGGSSGHMSELKDLFFVPLPLAAIAFGVANKVGKQDGA